LLALVAELIANDKPIVILHDGGLYLPIVQFYPETVFGGDFETEADYRDPFVQELIEDNGGTIIWPLIRYSYRTVNNEISVPAPAPPFWLQSREERCQRYELGLQDRNCTFGNFHILGTDDQARDVMARLIYGFRISVLFGLVLTILSSIIGIAAGAVQGLLRRLDRPHLPALSGDLDLDPRALSADHHRRRHRTDLLDPARHSAAVFLGRAGGRGACGIPARPEL
jgi:microcin C transport system permease protein